MKRELVGAAAVFALAVYFKFDSLEQLMHYLAPTSSVTPEIESAPQAVAWYENHAKQHVAWTRGQTVLLHPQLRSIHWVGEAEWCLIEFWTCDPTGELVVSRAWITQWSSTDQCAQDIGELCALTPSSLCTLSLVSFEDTAVALSHSLNRSFYTVDTTDPHHSLAFHAFLRGDEDALAWMWTRIAQHKPELSSKELADVFFPWSTWITQQDSWKWDAFSRAVHAHKDDEWSVEQLLFTHLKPSTSPDVSDRYVGVQRWLKSRPVAPHTSSTVAVDKTAVKVERKSTPVPWVHWMERERARPAVPQTVVWKAWTREVRHKLSELWYKRNIVELEREFKAWLDKRRNDEWHRLVNEQDFQIRQDLVATWPERRANWEAKYEAQCQAKYKVKEQEAEKKLQDAITQLDLALAERIKKHEQENENKFKAKTAALERERKNEVHRVTNLAYSSLVQASSR